MYLLSISQILNSVTRVQIQDDFTGLPKQWSGLEFLALGMISSESLIQLPKIRRIDADMGWKRKLGVGAAWQEADSVGKQR